VQAARKQDRRLSAALLAAALAHTPEAQQVLDGARMRMARKPSALARELLKNFPKGKRRRGGRRRRKKGGGDAEAAEGAEVKVTHAQGQETTEPESPPDEGPEEAPDEDVPPDDDAPGEQDVPDDSDDDQDAPGEEQDAPGEPRDERDAA